MHTENGPVIKNQTKNPWQLGGYTHNTGQANV